MSKSDLPKGRLRGPRKDPKTLLGKLPKQQQNYTLIKKVRVTKIYGFWLNVKFTLRAGS